MPANDFTQNMTTAAIRVVVLIEGSRCLRY
jgi:hypothetical protein